MKNISQNLCVLFDMDGVLINTEPQYDILWKQLGETYNIGIPNFEKIIKGTTTPNILSKYFSDYSQQEINTLLTRIEDFEERMEFPEVEGVMNFINLLKNNGYKIGLVTSSDDKKLNVVFKYFDFRKIFDTIVSANRIIKGKPDPMCYLLAAQDLGFSPEQCIVFEDSFAGIEAATQAKMKVIGVSTTIDAQQLNPKCHKVIPNFTDVTLESLLEIQ